MITIAPIQRALVPVDSAAAAKTIAPNYDEFQGDAEIYRFIQEHPDCILRVTMAHCDVASESDIGVDGSEDTLKKSRATLESFIAGDLMRVAEDVLWVYEITTPKRPELRQIGLGAAAKTAEIRTEDTPDGTVIRNEGIREDKARGRADLIGATQSYIGIVNNTVEDDSGRIAEALELYADGRACDFESLDEAGNRHRVWLVTDPAEQTPFIQLFAEEPFAFVADGNHRSAAAALLGRENYLSVFFTTSRMGLAPYNRLVANEACEGVNWLTALAEHFEIKDLGSQPDYAPGEPHQIGLYNGTTWLRLTPKASASEPGNAVQDIDADIVQRLILDGVLGITDARDKRLTYVGGNKDATWLRSKVDVGEQGIAITLAPVTMTQFVNVCKQNRYMPPKSTWFEPKIRSGLLVALFAEK